MLRSFLTRVVNSVTRVVLLVLCLLICLACVTPFPLESLEEGMTAETVRENFGEPEAMEAESGGGVWTYVHEELVPCQGSVCDAMPMPLQIAVSSLFLWMYPFHVFLKLTRNNDEWTWSPIPVMRKPVDLQFAGEKLVRWNVGSFASASRGSNAIRSDAWNEMQRNAQSDEWFRQRMKDIEHHKKGHTHHHGH